MGWGEHKKRSPRKSLKRRISIGRNETVVLWKKPREEIPLRNQRSTKSKLLPNHAG